MIPYARQSISDDDIQAVVEVLRSDFLTQGPVVDLFESAVSQYVEANHAVAFNSATSALHCACLALGVGAGDAVWTTSITFVASANCALYCGASVDFIDVDPKTYNLSIVDLSRKLEEAERAGKLPKVVIAVHFTGQPCQMSEIAELAIKYKFKIIEDASHAIGATYKGARVGGCKYSDITVFSFHPVKIITTGEGGMALTNNKSLAEKLFLFRSHGIVTDITKMELRPNAEIWNYQQTCLGFNYRMADINAAIGLSQMNKISSFIERRHSIAKEYDRLFQNEALQTPWQDPNGLSSYHLYVIRLKLDRIKLTHRSIFEKMRNAGIMVNLHYIPVYRQPYYERMGFQVGHCTEAEKYFSEAISLPMYPDLSFEDQLKVADSLINIITT